ncbi:MAG TPA: hypothetical protein DHW78_00435 [Ruminococcaceae bacterium]|nr:hypothetical protein [Oscillospiraceae bacterium]HCM22781.1 hypothetical protein [Oscillospiraceae bacterium]
MLRGKLHKKLSLGIIFPLCAKKQASKSDHYAPDLIAIITAAFPNAMTKILESIGTIILTGISTPDAA